MLLQVLAGYDPADPMSRNEPVPKYVEALQTNTRRFRLGVPRVLLTKELDAEHDAAFAQALRVLRDNVTSIRDVELPPVRLTIGIDTSAEFYPEHEAFITRSPEQYQPQTRRTMEAAGRVTACGPVRPQPIRDGASASGSTRGFLEGGPAGIADVVVAAATYRRRPEEAAGIAESALGDAV